MKNIFLFIGLIFLYSCFKTSKARSHNLDDSYEMISKTKDINYLIEYSQKLPCIYGTRIGIEGRYNPDGEYFKRLNELASDSLLVSLTKSRYPNLRISSFLELEKRNSTLLPQIRKILSQDTGSVCFISGDFSTYSTVGQMVQFLSSK